MADRYVVAAGGNWSSTATWSTANGGSGGASVPTASDNVFLTSVSGNVTTANADTCLTLDCSGYTGILTIGGSFDCYGGLTLGAGMSLGGSGWVFNFRSTTNNGGPGWPITTNGVSIPRSVTFSGVGGKWTLQDAFTMGSNAGTLTFGAGTLDTNSQPVTNASGGAVMLVTGNGVRTLTMGSSVITGGINISGSNITITSNTATLVQNGSGTNQPNTGGFNFNGASFQSTKNLAPWTGGGIFTNVTLNGDPSQGNLARVLLSGNVTATGTLTIAGNSSTNRLIVQSDTLGTPRVITAAATSLTDVDFMDIAIVGPVGSTITSDSFNRADGALGTTDAAAGGSPLAWTVNGQITSNVVVGSSSATNVVDVGVSDFSASITMTTLPSGGHAGLSVRGDGGAGTRIMFGASTAATPSRLQVILGYVALVDLTMGLIPAGATMELRVIGSVAVALVNGVVYGSVAIPSTMTVTNKVGITTQPAAQMDNFIVKELPNVSGTRLGDCLGNSGITFTTASGTARDGGGAGVKRYAVAAGNFSSTAVWSESDGGAPGASVPLPQDDVYLTASSGAGTYNINMPRSCRNLDCTGFTRTLNNGGSDWSLYGNLKIVPGMAWAFTAIGPNFRGRGSQTIDTSGVVPGGGITNSQIQAPGGTYTLLSDLSLNQTTQANLYVGNGTFNANGYNVTANRLDAPATGTKTVNFGSGTWNLGFNGTVAVNLGAATTVIADASTIVINSAASVSRDFTAPVGSVFGTVTYTVADSPGALTITGANTFGTLNVGSGRSLKLPSNTQTTVGTLNVAGVPRGGVRLPGVSGSYLSTPDSAVLDITTDITIDVKVTIPDWTPSSEYVLVSKWGVSQQSYALDIVNAGRPRFYISTTGSDAPYAEATARVIDAGVVDGGTKWVRSSRNSTTGMVSFYLSDDGVTWSQLGSDVALAGTIFSGSKGLEIGSATNGTVNVMTGTVHRARVYNSALGSGSGTPAFDTDFTPSRFWPFFLDAANRAIVTPNTTLANVGDGRVVIESATAGTSATLNVTGQAQIEGTDLKDITINGGVTLGAQCVVRSNVKGVKRSPRRQGLMVGA